MSRPPPACAGHLRRRLPPRSQSRRLPLLHGPPWQQGSLLPSPTAAQIGKSKRAVRIVKHRGYSARRRALRLVRTVHTVQGTTERRRRPGRSELSHYRRLRDGTRTDSGTATATTAAAGAAQYQPRQWPQRAGLVVHTQRAPRPIEYGVQISKFRPLHPTFHAAQRGGGATAALQRIVALDAAPWRARRRVVVAPLRVALRRRDGRQSSEFQHFKLTKVPTEYRWNCCDTAVSAANEAAASTTAR